MSRRQSSLRDIQRLSQLSGDLNLTARNLDSDNDSVFGSPIKPVYKKRGSILKRKSSFGGFTAPSTPTPRNTKKILKKTVSFGNLAARLSVTSLNSGPDRRLSSVGDVSQLVEDDKDWEAGKRNTRRMSMMSSLREELMQLDKVKVKRFQDRQTQHKLKHATVEREKSEEILGNKSARENFALAKHRPSVPTLPVCRSDSLGSDDQLLSSYDLKKFQMLQSLEKMGVDLKKSRASQAQLNDESAILRLAAARGNRHGSLTSRTLIAHFGGVQQTPSPGQPVEPIDQATRDKLQKVYDQMIKPEAKMTALPGLAGRNRASVSSDEIATETLGIFRKRLRRKKKPQNKLRRLGRFVLILLRLWNHHANRVNEVLEYVHTVEMDSSDQKDDLFFDITQFKAEKEAHVPEEAKRILKKRPKERTEEEIHYVQIALRNYKALAEYPVHMQKRIAACAWFEGFGPKRVIVREGHIPMCFYFVMSGSAVVSVMDLERGMAKTVLYYGRGDSFGELAIMNATRRQSTVISKEAIELLVLSDEDFVDIFMSGGLKDPNDPFLCSLPYLDGWPLEKLSENPKKAQFCYYKRGAILVKDSKVKDWIIIVKSGSCRLLVKLNHVDPRKRVDVMKRRQEWRDALVDDYRSEEYLTHEERLHLAYTSEIRALEKENQLMRFYALPEIFIQPNEGYQELKKLHAEHAEHVGTSIADKIRESATLESASISRNPTNMSMERQRTGSGVGTQKFGSLVKKGPYMGKSRTHSQAEMLQDQIKMGTTFSDFLKENAEGPSAMDMHQENKKTEPPPMFVNVQTLTKGMVFGLSDIFFEDQPNLVLVSNSAECITINKKLFMDNASHAFVTRLREDIYPYPSQDDLQENLESQVHWDYHKRQRVGDVVRAINFKVSEIHDARAATHQNCLTETTARQRKTQSDRRSDMKINRLYNR